MPHFLDNPCFKKIIYLKKLFGVNRSNFDTNILITFLLAHKNPRTIASTLANVNIKKLSVIAHDLSILNFDACKGVYLYWNTFKSITRSAIQQKIQNGSNRKWL